MNTIFTFTNVENKALTELNDGIVFAEMCKKDSDVSSATDGTTYSTGAYKNTKNIIITGVINANKQGPNP